MLPDFHGNRSPLADPHALGVISGLTLDASFDSLCRLYWRTASRIALGVRHILETLNAGGFVIDTLHVTGGHTQNPLLMELYADATGCTVVEPLADEAVLLGTAWSRRPPPGSIRISPAPAPACASAGGSGGRTPRHERASTATTASSSRCTASGRRWTRWSSGLDGAEKSMKDAGVSFAATAYRRLCRRWTACRTMPRN